MKLIVGLGNPGTKYRFTRHNIGFLVIDHLSDKFDIAVGQKKFDAFYGKGKIGTVPVMLAKPQTFMNLSGFAVQRLIDYFEIGIQDLIVIHDDLDLPFPSIRLKSGGGHGGHKGLMSIIEQSGTGDFTRVRLGIGKPAHKGLVESYVLELFSKDEMEFIPNIIEEASMAIMELLSSGIQAAMNQYHGKSIKIFNEEV
jgi:peptidyl-tRNA hydrolase, PTH1 family